MTLHDLLLPYQARFVDNPKRRKIWLSSRQVGKSHAASYIAVYKALARQNGLTLCISTGSRAATELLKKCARMAEAAHVLMPGLTYSASADSIKFANGSRVVSLPSGNPASLRGWSAQCIVLDEAAFLENPEDVWAAIAPTLLRDPEAEIVLCSTPAGAAGWFYDLYGRALESDDWYVQTTTIEDAVKDGLRVDVAELRKTITDPAVWDQEFMCRFASEYGAMIDTDLLEFADPEVKDSFPHWLGFDVGSTSDRSALVDLVELPDRTLFVRDVAVLHKASYESQLQILREKHEKLKYRAGYVDANGIGGPVAEFASKRVSAKIKGFTWTAQNKPQAYEDLRALIFDRKIKFASGLRDLIVGDFRNVHRIVNEAGKVSYSAGRDANGHSDVTSALVLAVQAQKHTPNQMSAPYAPRPTSVFGFPSSLF